MASITKVVAGNTMQASDLNQALAVLQRASGDTEVGALYIEGCAHAVGCIMSVWINAWSRGTTPVSVSYGAFGTPYGPTNVSTTPATSHLSTYGFQTYVSSTAAAADCFIGQIFTLQY